MHTQTFKKLEGTLVNTDDDVVYELKQCHVNGAHRIELVREVAL